MSICVAAVVRAASCCVSWAFVCRRRSAACASATSRATDAATWFASRVKPLNSVHDRPKRQENVSGELEKLLNGEPGPWRLSLEEGLGVGQDWGRPPPAFPPRARALGPALWRRGGR